MHPHHGLLDRIHAVLSGYCPDTRAEDSSVRRGPASVAPTGADRLIACMRESSTTVHRVSRKGLPAAIAGTLNRYKAERVAVPEDMPAQWLSALPDSVAVLRDEAPLSPHQRDVVHAHITTCRLSAAPAGGVAVDCGSDRHGDVLDHPAGHHVCVLCAPDDLAAELGELAPAWPMVWITRPFTTASVEPTRDRRTPASRTLDVILVS
ncbi:hypothetical protein ACFP1Z_31400 [Streptomyces gamaensis]|uniref:LUD domain-containing protein n=1 Tax=Streptomyces gamaensis TaxID=1763542 RepID=A0ABW0ZCH7_9ACTN